MSIVTILFIISDEKNTDGSAALPRWAKNKTFNANHVVASSSTSYPAQARYHYNEYKKNSINSKGGKQHPILLDLIFILDVETKIVSDVSDLLSKLASDSHINSYFLNEENVTILHFYFRSELADKIQSLVENRRKFIGNTTLKKLPFGTEYDANSLGTMSTIKSLAEGLRTRKDPFSTNSGVIPMMAPDLIPKQQKQNMRYHSPKDKQDKLRRLLQEVYDEYGNDGLFILRNLLGVQNTNNV